MITLEQGKPNSVNIHAKKFWNHTVIGLKVGQQYLLKAEGKWIDWYIETDANGYSRWYLRPYEIFRRMRRENWFALIGTIGESLNNAFLIGMGPTDYMPPISGELVCFANDMPGFYWNNYGSVQLTVTRKI
jgi:hypothetical protein